MPNWLAGMASQMSRKLFCETKGLPAAEITAGFPEEFGTAGPQ